MAIDTLCPTGNGALIEWDPSDATNWQQVDDCAVADEDSTFISTSTAAERNLSAFGAFAISADSVQDVTVRYRARLQAAGTASVRPMLRVNGINYFGATQALTTSYVSYAYAWTTNPDTAASWTEAAVNGGGPNPLQQIGIELESTSATVARCTEYYVEANYTPAAPADDGLVARGPQLRQPPPQARAKRTNRIAKWYTFPTFVPAELPVEDFISPGSRANMSQPKPRSKRAANEAYWIPNDLATEAPPEPAAETFLLAPTLPVRQRYRLRKAPASAYWMHNPFLPPDEVPDLASNCTVVGGAWVLGLDAEGGVFIVGMQRCKPPGHWGRKET